MNFSYPFHTMKIPYENFSMIWVWIFHTYELYKIHTEIILKIWYEFFIRFSYYENYIPKFQYDFSLILKYQNYTMKWKMLFMNVNNLVYEVHSASPQLLHLCVHCCDHDCWSKAELRKRLISSRFRFRFHSIASGSASASIASASNYGVSATIPLFRTNKGGFIYMGQIMATLPNRFKISGHK